ncbi:MAG: VPLPA-CTERM sorting domain-containing protein [Gammaproteobacteria bacterium]
MKGKLCALMALACATPVEAAPVTLNSAAVDIVYDADDFSFYREDDGYFAGSVIRTSVDFAALALSGIANGIRLEFNDAMSLVDQNHGSSDNQQAETAYFHAPFSFSARPGYRITGYTVTLIGSFYITDPAYARAFVNGVAEIYVDRSTNVFAQSFTVAGSDAPLLEGGLEAFSLTEEYTVHVGDDYVQTGTSWEPDPGCIDEECPLIEVPVFEYVPRYETYYDGGDANIRLDALTLVANVAPVPLPASAWMLAPALAALGALRRRATRSAALAPGNRSRRSAR